MEGSYALPLCRWSMTAPERGLGNKYTFAFQRVNVTLEPAQLRTSVANKFGSGSSYDA